MPKTIFQFCGTCAFYSPQTMSCPLMPYFNGKMKNTDYCSKYSNELIKCARCGNILLKPNIVSLNENEYVTYCDDCLMSLR